jgi:hypothetical protein
MGKVAQTCDRCRRRRNSALRGTAPTRAGQTLAQILEALTLESVRASYPAAAVRIRRNWSRVEQARSERRRERLGLGIFGRSGYGLGFGDDVSRRRQPLRPGLRGKRGRVGLWSTPPRRQLPRAVYSSLDLDSTSPHPTALTFVLGRVRAKTVVCSLAKISGRRREVSLNG